MSYIALSPNLTAAQAKDQQAAMLEAQATTQRHQLLRDQAIRTLRKQDSKTWTYKKLAALIGVSSFTVEKILKG